MLTDRFGKEIRPGALITYPTRHSSGMWVVDSCVDAVEDDKIYVLGLHIKYFWSQDGKWQIIGTEVKPKRYVCQADRERITVVNYEGRKFFAKEMEELKDRHASR